MREFRIAVDEAVLDDLRRRLDGVRWPAFDALESADAGVPADRMREIVAHWRDHYDWRQHERRLNEWPQFIASVGGTDIHFVHRRSHNPDARAIVLSHGWPYTFAEMLPLAKALDDFHVVVPSIPGYVFSAPLSERYRPAAVAELWHQLMTEQLGYDQYLTYGEDVGASVSDWLAASHPEAVIGVHATHAVFTPPARREDQSAQEAEFFEWMSAKWKRASGYASMQATRPHTLAVALSDSPVGLAAWIIEKLDAWSEVPFSLDDELTTVMLYWISGSIGTSFRPYADDELDTAVLPVITVPAAVAVQTGESEYPRAMAERNYSDLRSFHHLPRGGHFTAAESPDLIAHDLRALVATLQP